MNFRKIFKNTFPSNHVLLVTIALMFLSTLNFADELFTPEDTFNLKNCSSATISPNGEWIAYLLSYQREANDKPGPAYRNLYLVSTRTKQVKPFIIGKENVSSIQWSPDGKEIAFLLSRGEKSKTQIWSIRIDGGESQQLTNSESDINNFQWHPSSKKIAYVAATTQTKREEALAEKGYNFIYFEENLKHLNLYMIEKKDSASYPQPEQLTRDITVWDFIFSNDGNLIALSASPKNLVDHSYMFKKIHLLHLQNNELKLLVNNPGKLGNFQFSPDDSMLVYTAAKMREDHAVSQVYIANLNGGEPKNLTPENFRGHISWAAWKDNSNIVYHAGEGVWNTLSLVNVKGGERNIILDGKTTGIIFTSPECTKDLKHFAFIGSTAEIPSEVYYWQYGGKLQKLTDVNSWVAQRMLGKQEKITWKARDNRQIEGIIIYPVNYKQGNKYPLIVSVHGGPEYHYTNGWLTNYFEPAQVYSGKGYVSFFPNYRASTGYGIDFAMEGYGDAAGKEFDDIADGIKYLADIGLADANKVGLGGGSYGGYAAAWFSSYYTQYVKAVVMFVGISDLISKKGSTDIPYEELYVHSGKKLDESWEFQLKRSPIYYAAQSKSAVLIVGGADDPRVHPSQSLEYYRRLKMNNHPAVRLVQYPGEGHGNRKQPGRIDILHRQLQWYDWYVKDSKPIDGSLPPMDISDLYGLDLKEKDK
ncbi:MAG: hypothetical protein A2Y62_15195 [Candidatus Fischerbacteria bacterium RBG_13_37_8]|uniref:Peptidase S9 prolyl oligopeptidase catalytic domain-containing protein n=1 Tax=Candidatus Fischerbacteria bacterium RBG_13_37_8 TaxID=1817863 RepID=A0A1F5V787_9BACT|nr:MAG: hypothetical protein A2Y62_15195 [Candidatus Fischerbacteria bacterium RBG_13_37_8]